MNKRVNYSDFLVVTTGTGEIIEVSTFNVLMFDGIDCAVLINDTEYVMSFDDCLDLQDDLCK